ncbi:hypothetical protein Tco_0467467, partial [Tanacetum coccineum]
LFRSHVAEYGARYAQFVAVHTYVTAVIEAEVRIMQKLQENGQNRTNTDTGTEIVHKSQKFSSKSLEISWCNSLIKRPRIEDSNDFKNGRMRFKDKRESLRPGSFFSSL